MKSHIARQAATSCRSGGLAELHELLVLFTQPLDAQSHLVARLQEHRRGFMPIATPGGVPVVITSPGSSVMNWLTYDTSVAQSKIIVFVLPSWRLSPLTSSHMSSFCGLAHFVARHEPGADRAEGIAALALVPGGTTLHLVFALGHVVDHHIAGDMVERRPLAHVLRARADDDAQFDLVVGLDGILRDDHVVVRRPACTTASW